MVCDTVKDHFKKKVRLQGKRRTLSQMTVVFGIFKAHQIMYMDKASLIRRLRE